MLGNNTNNSEYIIDTLRVDITSAAQDIVDNLPDVTTMATKDDVKNAATRDDVKTLATKEDISNLATKEEIKDIKDYLKSMNERLYYKIDSSMLNIKVGYPWILGHQFVQYDVYGFGEDPNIEVTNFQLNVRIEFYNTFILFHVLQETSSVVKQVTKRLLMQKIVDWDYGGSDTYKSKLNTYLTYIQIPLSLRLTCKDLTTGDRVIFYGQEIHRHDFSFDIGTSISPQGIFIPVQTIKIITNSEYRGDNFF